jgi:3-mercaptopyruvate sulfurtransferase SseA
MALPYDRTAKFGEYAHHVPGSVELNWHTELNDPVRGPQRDR